MNKIHKFVRNLSKENAEQKVALQQLQNNTEWVYKRILTPQQPLSHN